MKIVRIIARLNVGGPARHVTWLTEHLRPPEFESVLVAGTVPAGEEDMSYIAHSAGVEPLYIAEMSRELSLKDGIVLWKLFNLLRRERPDIVHTHTAKAGTIGRIASLAYKMSRPRKGAVKIVHTFHGHVFHSYYSPSKTRLFLLIERFLAHFATDKIITISEQQRSEILEKFRIGSAGQFEIIPLGIDLDSLVSPEQGRDEARAEIGLADDEVAVGFVGRLTEIKIVPMLLEAAEIYSKLDAPGLPKLRFVIAGDGHLRGELEAETAKRGVADIVTFIGNRTDIAAVYSAIEIVALTSLNEGTPLSLIEGMAAGKPFMATSVGGVVDLLGQQLESCDGFNVFSHGASSASRDAAGFAAGLLYLAGNERLRTSMAREGRRYVRENYSKDRLVNDIKALYRRLVASAPDA